MQHFAILAMASKGNLLWFKNQGWDWAGIEGGVGLEVTIIALRQLCF